MRKKYRKFLTKEEADALIVDFFVNYKPRIPISKDSKYTDSRSKYHKSKTIEKIIDKLREDFDFEINEESYWTVEHRKIGHAWHVDTGARNHMLWCQVGVSIILNPSIKGGDTWYAEDKSGKNAINSHRGLYDLCAHTSNEWHKVDAHEGNRIVLLMFI